MAARDPERTRHAILTAARSEFAARGPAGARVDRIAAAAGVNKRMIYHYFGSKDGLWDAVLDDQLQAQAIVLSGVGPSIADRLTAAAQRVAGDPDVTRLLAWEALTQPDGGAAPRTALWRSRVAELREAQRDGDLSTRIDAAQLELALTALLLFPYAFPKIAQIVTGRAVTDPAFTSERTTFFRALEDLLKPPVQTPVVPPKKPRLRLTAAVTESRG